MTGPTEPTFDESDIEDTLMDELPTGDETLPLTQNDQRACDALAEFFANARPF